MTIKHNDDVYLAIHSKIYTRPDWFSKKYASYYRDMRYFVLFANEWHLYKLEDAKIDIEIVSIRPYIDIWEYAGRGYDSESLKTLAKEHDNGKLFTSVINNSDSIDAICQEYYQH